MADALYAKPLAVGPNEPAPTVAPLNDGSLLDKITPYLDRHFVLKVASILESEEGKSAKELSMLRWQVYEHSLHTDDVVLETYALAHNVAVTAIPAAVKDMIASRKARIAESETKATAFLSTIDAVLKGDISVSPDADYTGPVPHAPLDVLFAHARVLYESGAYATAHAALSLHQTLSTKLSATDRRPLAQLWGYAAAAIMADALPVAATTLRVIADTIRDSPQALAARLYVAHWGLLVFFLPLPTAPLDAFVAASAADASAAAGAADGIPSGCTAARSSLAGHADWFVRNVILEERYRICSAVQAAAPHLLRYMSVALISSKLRTTGRGTLRPLTTALVQEQRVHNDSICSFVRLLNDARDVAGAQAALRASRDVLARDIFLKKRASDFMDGAWVLLFETVCRAHSRVSVDYIGERMSLSADEAESWVVGLIRDARLDARYDTEQRHVIMRAPQRSAITHLRERCKFLLSRTIVISQPTAVPSVFTVGLVVPLTFPSLRPHACAWLSRMYSCVRPCRDFMSPCGLRLPSRLRCDSFPVPPQRPQRPRRRSRSCRSRGNRLGFRILNVTCHPSTTVCYCLMYV